MFGENNRAYSYCSDVCNVCISSKYIFYILHFLLLHRFKGILTEEMIEILLLTASTALPISIQLFSYLQLIHFL